MPDLSDLGYWIRFPFEIFGFILNFLLKNLISILIVLGTIYFIYWFFSSKIYERFVLLFRKKEIINTNEMKSEEEDGEK